MITTMHTRQELAAKIDAFPRVDIAHTPTPLDEMSRLRERLAGRRSYSSVNLHQTGGHDRSCIRGQQSTALRV